MPREFKNSPAVFQAIRYKILSDLIGTCCGVYLDDAIIHRQTLEKQNININEVFTRIKKQD